MIEDRYVENVHVYSKYRRGKRSDFTFLSTTFVRSVHSLQLTRDSIHLYTRLTLRIIDPHRYGDARLMITEFSSWFQTWDH